MYMVFRQSSYMIVQTSYQIMYDYRVIVRQKGYPLSKECDIIMDNKNNKKWVFCQQSVLGERNCSIVSLQCYA
uniref:Uncharacterized protein n=1 Tax=Lepeophtheirus salmonis TaxID=72036 RepID=A0A0K2TLX2_LEPSM